MLALPVEKTDDSIMLVKCDTHFLYIEVQRYSKIIFVAYGLNQFLLKMCSA